MAEDKKKTEDPTSPEASKDAEAKEEKKVEKPAEKSKEVVAEKKDAPEKKEGEEKTEAPAAPVKKKKVRRQVQKGCVFIASSYNNTSVSFSDLHGNRLVWSTAGLLGFKGAKKATTYAANQVVLDAHEKVQRYGLKDVKVFIKGVGAGRDAALRALAQKGYNLISIKDVTPIPHNGCRPKKPRRV